MERSVFIAFSLACLVGCTQAPPEAKEPTNSPPRVEQKKQSTDDVESAVRRIVADRLKQAPQSVDMGKPIADGLILVSIVMTLEERFVLEIPDGIIEKHGQAKLGDPACKLSPSQLVAIVMESQDLASRKR